MMPLNVVFWMLVIIFGLVGGFRGWAKEMLVLFSMVLALFLIWVLETYVATFTSVLNPQEGSGQFLIRSTLLLLLAFFGYQSPNLPLGALGSKLARERLQDWLLGTVLGMLNGYFIVGSLWYYMHAAGYPWPDLVLPPSPEIANTMVPFLPPKVLGGPPYILFAIGAAFVFVIIVFL